MQSDVYRNLTVADNRLPTEYNRRHLSGTCHKDTVLPDKRTGMQLASPDGQKINFGLW